MKRTLFAALALATAFPAFAALQPQTEQAARAAIQKGIAYLKSTQKADGSWSDPQFPALTGMPLWALAVAGHTGADPAVSNATAFVVSKAQADGGLYTPIPGRRGGGLGNYNTCLCVNALHAVVDLRPRLAPVILRARAYIAATQQAAEGIHAGGFGYDRNADRLYTDMNNTFYAADAIRRTQDVEESRPAGEKRVDIDWAAALAYTLRMQKTEGPETGGFVYNLQDPKAGVENPNADRPVLRAYGSMTYAGLLTMLHARLEKSDPRVRSTLAYLGRYWTLEENQNMGSQGLYFYYTVIARAMSAANLEAIPREGADPVLWREALIEKLVSLQREDGSWANENNRFWEADPALATSYALLALEFAAGLTR